MGFIPTWLDRHQPITGSGPTDTGTVSVTAVGSTSVAAYGYSDTPTTVAASPQQFSIHLGNGIRNHRYGLNNPLKYSDPFGLDPCTAVRQVGARAASLDGGNAGGCTEPTSGQVNSGGGGGASSGPVDVTLFDDQGNVTEVLSYDTVTTTLPGDIDTLDPNTSFLLDLAEMPGDTGGSGGAGPTYKTTKEICLIGNCNIKIYWGNNPFGNVCSASHGKNGATATVYTVWDCHGDISTCAKNQPKFRDDCYARGQVPLDPQQWFTGQGSGGQFYYQPCCSMPTW